MRRFLLALVCVGACPAIFMAQNKTLPQPPVGRGETAAGAIDSICDANTSNLAANCGFENGDFSNWSLGGPTDLVNVDPSAANSGSFGSLFGTVGDYTALTQSLPAPTSDGVSFHVEYWLANEVGGSGTYFDALWSADGTFDDAIDLCNLTDADPFDWTLNTNGPLPSQSGVQPSIGFVFRHDPDFWWLDDLDVEVSSSSAGSQVVAREAIRNSRRMTSTPRLAHLTPAVHQLLRVMAQSNGFGRFGLRSPAEMFRSFVQKVKQPNRPHPRRRIN